MTNSPVIRSGRSCSPAGSTRGPQTARSPTRSPLDVQGRLARHRVHCPRAGPRETRWQREQNVFTRGRSQVRLPCRPLAFQAWRRTYSQTPAKQGIFLDPRLLAAAPCNPLCAPAAPLFAPLFRSARRSRASSASWRSAASVPARRRPHGPDIRWPARWPVRLEGSGIVSARESGRPARRIIFWNVVRRFWMASR